jgi:hypothetical protein
VEIAAGEQLLGLFARVTRARRLAGRARRVIRLGLRDPHGPVHRVAKLGQAV